MTSASRPGHHAPFNETFVGITSALPVLFLSHSTNVRWLERIVADDRLHVPDEPCRVLKVPSLYCYYGPPRYRPPETTSAAVIAARLVGVILNPSLLDKVRDIFPFDSGAFVDGRYSFADPGLHFSLPEFRIHPHPQAPGQIVARFFGTNERYIDGLPLPPTPRNAHEEFLGTLYGAKGVTTFDDRSLAIELVFGEPIVLSEHVLAIIAPKSVNLHGWSVDEAARDLLPGRVHYYDDIRRISSPLQDLQSVREVALRLSTISSGLGKSLS